MSDKIKTTNSTEELWQALKEMRQEDRERYFEKSRVQGFASQLELAWRQQHAPMY